MALSFSSVQKAYEVFNELKKIVPLSIPSWPEDMYKWSIEEQKNPPLNTVIGWDKKADDGWGNIVFFIKGPPKKLVERFNELKKKVPNSSYCEPYRDNPEIWVIGWF